jgi:NitT/TauT family transport system substrate-binding protein
MPRQIKLVQSLALGLALAGSVAWQASAQTKPDQVTFALNWLATGEAAGWFLALDKGYFKENNIDVTIVRGFGSGDTAKRVAAKRAEFGVVDMGSVILQRINEGIRVRGVGMFYGRAPHAVFFREKLGLKSPKDLEGKTIACPATSANKLMFPAFAAGAGIDANAVKWRIADPTVAIATFAAGQADAVCEFLTSGPKIVAQTPDKTTHFLYADYGFRVYANAVVAHEDTIKANPDLVRRFVKAAMRGLDYSVKHPDEAVKALLKHQPENKPELAMSEWKVAAGLIMTDEAKANGVGYMDPSKMTATYDIVTSAFNLDKAKDSAANIFSNDYLK